MERTAEEKDQGMNEQKGDSVQDAKQAKKDGLGEEEIELFKNYIQCFKNKKAEELMQDPRFEGLRKTHKFWDTQPVPKPHDITSDVSGPLENKKLSEVSKDPVKLPAQFEWIDLDLTNDASMKEIYTLLYENYVEDDDGYFRFDYSTEFLKWALLPPGAHADLYFGIRDKSRGDMLVGFISGIVVDMIAEKKHVKATEVNFLCVHKSYRSFSMASVLIKEVVRRSNIKGVWQGVYTSGTLLPTPIAQARYYHRSLNPKKLIEVRFSYLPSNSKISTQQKLYALPEKPNLPAETVLRPAELRDCKQIHQLVTSYLEAFDISQNYTKREAQHWFINRPNILESYVIEVKGKVTDFFCLYSLPSTVLKNSNHNTLRAAYAYYFVNKTMSLKNLFEIALIKARDLGYDVFNALDIMENSSMFEELHFAGGDGYLNYYLYNWKLAQKILQPHRLGMVLM